ncbi:MAG TPA: hypothetical protein VGM10_30705 [Actinocrinis sp.]
MDLLAAYDSAYWLRRLADPHDLAGVGKLIEPDGRAGARVRWRELAHTADSALDNLFPNAVARGGFERQVTLRLACSPACPDYRISLHMIEPSMGLLCEALSATLARLAVGPATLVGTRV